MANEKYVLEQGEVILCKESCVRHGFWGAYTNILIITNYAVVLEKYGMFCNCKGVEKYPYNTIKSAIIGAASNGEQQLEIYLDGKTEDFALQSGDGYRLEKLLTTINEQLILYTSCLSLHKELQPTNEPTAYEINSIGVTCEVAPTIPNRNATIFCTECGAKHRAEDKFCSNCGSSLHLKVVESVSSFDENTKMQEEALRLQVMQLQLEMQRLNEDRKQSLEQKRMADLQEEKFKDLPKCPKCGSTALSSNKKGYGIGKGIVGATLFGPIGLAAGAIGSGKVVLTCLKCGHKFKPGKTFWEFLNSL